MIFKEKWDRLYDSRMVGLVCQGSVEFGKLGEVRVGKCVMGKSIAVKAKLTRNLTFGIK